MVQRQVNLQRRVAGIFGVGKALDDVLQPSWSPDSKWITYVKQLDNRLRAVYLYSLEKSQPNQVTDGRGDARYIVFDRSGKYIFFTASTNLGPTISFADLSGIDHQTSRSVYAIVLRNDTPSPIAPESDEEKILPEKKDAPPVVMPSVTPTPKPSPTPAPSPARTPEENPSHTPTPTLGRTPPGGPPPARPAATRPGKPPPGAISFRPPRTLGMLVGASLASWALVTAAFAIVIAAISEPELSTFIAWCPGAFGIALAPLFVY